ncbi:MAG: ABC transporter ATP-binding protein [Clostridia bacterium]
MNKPILEIRDLSVEYNASEESVLALNKVNINLYPREILGIVGESGCGKSTLAYGVMNYLGKNALISGAINFGGENLLDKSDREMDHFRGNKIAIINQNPFTSLNPSLKLGKQLAEVAVFHRKMKYKDAMELSRDMLISLNLPDPDSILRRYPHEISGGMQQRICIAMGLMCQPSILIMDEPTTALDVTTEVVILDLCRNLVKQFDTAIIYISHDLGIISSISDRIAVMYRGEIAELAEKDELFSNPQHPYTKALINCIPRHGVTKDQKKLATIPGYITNRNKHDESCPFLERCKYSSSEGCINNYGMQEIIQGHWTACSKVSIAENEVILDKPEPRIIGKQDEVPLLNVENLTKIFPSRSKKYIAVDDISFHVNRNRVFGIVGESGCGKSTTALCIEGLLETNGGRIEYKGEDITKTWQKRSGNVLKEIQMVFQDPARSLNPFYTVEQIIGRPIKVLRGIKSKIDRRKIIIELLHKVGLSEQYINKKTSQMSGGERQRVAIARVFALKPDLVICDEPTSALDVSVQAAVLNLLVELQQETDEISYIFISHDLHVVNYISDFVMIMYLGKICEFGRTAEVFSPPYHPYTEALLSAVPEVGGGSKKSLIRLEGSVPVPDGTITGCHFHTRCPRKIGNICEREIPPKVNLTDTHYIHCHLPNEKLEKMESVF